MAAEPLEPVAAALLASLRRDPRQFRVEALTAGGNNRVYRLEGNGEKLALKCYWYDPVDSRDRLGAEYAFLSHAWDLGLRCVPQPLACDPGAHAALYEYVEGERPAATELGEARVLEAARFFAALNGARSRALAVALSTASEACFSVAEHLRMVDGRLGLLATLRLTSPTDREAAAFVAELGRAWEGAKHSILSAVKDPDEPLPTYWRCLSPSDFGFHNTLVRPGGDLCFLDFEYAGWDDPAKAFGDFFAHPGLPVSRAHVDRFLEAAFAPFEHTEALMARARLLEPVFRTKWCCIILNEFVPDAARRRRFADPAADTEARKVRQLDKARTLFETLTI